MSKRAPFRIQRIVCLSNVYDENYVDLRKEAIAPSLSSPKRRDLFRCLALATGREVVLLSAPPKALDRKKPRWLSAVETRFDVHRQFFCPNWDAPKIRIPLSWFFYARHVWRHVRDGDLLLIDNYELIYLIAARLVRLRSDVRCVLEYEDGKHLIDRSIWRLLSGTAEFLGRGIFDAAIVAQPALSERLPAKMPRALVPGFVNETSPCESASGDVHFLYSGTLDRPRGVDLLLESLEFLPAEGWHLDISGSGELTEEIARVAEQQRWKGRLKFHAALAAKDYDEMIGGCHVGLNCQRTDDPISRITFPSKVFSYLSAGLAVLSSRASQIETVCGKACIYYDDDHAPSLAAAMTELIRTREIWQKIDINFARDRYSLVSTANRLRELFSEARLV